MFAAVLCMAAQTLLMRAALESWPVSLAGIISRAVAFTMLGAWVLATGSGWRRFKPRGTGWWLVLMCLVSALLNFALFNALKWTTATNHAILYRLDTILVVLIGSVLGIERIGWKEFMLLPLMLLGIALLAEVGRSGFQVHWAGDLLVITAAAAFAVNAFVNRHIVQTMEPESMAVYNIAAGSLGFVVVSITEGEWAWLARGAPSLGAWLILVVLGLLIAGFVPAYYLLLRHVPVWKLRTWMLIVPLLVAGADWLVWGTRLTGWQWLGTALLLGGLAALIRLERRDRINGPP